MTVVTISLTPRTDQSVSDVGKLRRSMSRNTAPPGHNRTGWKEEERSEGELEKLDAPTGAAVFQTCLSIRACTGTGDRS